MRSLSQEMPFFVIPDLIRNPVLSKTSWIPAFAGMTGGMDSRVCPGPRSGIRGNDNLRGNPVFCETVSFKYFYFLFYNHFYGKL